MNLTLYRNLSEPYKIGKNLESVTALSGTLRDQCSIIDPVIVIEADPIAIGGTNYIYVSEFGRYFFVQNFTILRSNLVELKCHVDVLESFADEIKACKGIVSKSESLWNLYLNDGSLKTYQNPIVITNKFPSGFNDYQFVLAVAGSAQTPAQSTNTGGSTT